MGKSFFCFLSVIAFSLKLLKLKNFHIQRVLVLRFGEQKYIYRQQKRNIENREVVHEE